MAVPFPVTVFLTLPVPTMMKLNILISPKSFSYYLIRNITESTYKVKYFLQLFLYYFNLLDQSTDACWLNPLGFYLLCIQLS